MIIKFLKWLFNKLGYRLCKKPRKFFNVPTTKRLSVYAYTHCGDLATSYFTSTPLLEIINNAKRTRKKTKKRSKTQGFVKRKN